jgi:hypothetical protein
MEDSPDGCFGVLRIQKQMFCLTLEPPDQANKAWTSCIPVQQYICIPFESPKFGRTYIVSDVPDREKIVFHSGNWLSDTQGCILLGDSLLHLSGRRGVANSRDTFKKFMHILGDTEEAHLTISVGY